MSDTWSIAALDGAFDNQPAPLEVNDEQLEQLLTQPIVHDGPKESCPAWSPVRLRPNERGEYRRAARYVESVSCLVLDLDRGEPLKRALALIAGRRAMLHTSWRHTADYPKGRLTFPFSEPVPAAKWPLVWGAAERWARTVELTIDPAAKDCSRLYFLPAYPAGNEERKRAFWARAWVGELLSWRWLATQYPPPREEVRAFAPVATPLQRGLPGQDRTAQRAHFAARIIETRVRELQSAGEGGRNSLAFRAGAVAGQLAAAGVLNLGSARVLIINAAIAAGLSPREAEGTVDNGIRRGEADGPFSF
jgi:hypothetical protein